jgi:ABC-type multidrug transport system fused ATPase/permease subunit
VLDCQEGRNKECLSLLLLDEATSSLDATTEKEVQKSLDQLMSHQSTIIVSHRLSSIRNVDRIYVVDEGVIVESGRHHDLMDKKGVYYTLYNRQLEEVLA